MTTMKRSLVLLVLVAGSCDVWGEDNCDTGLAPGIEILVVDSVTGEALPDEAIRVVATADTFAEASGRTYGGWAQLVHERADTYRVAVTAEGYEPWTVDGVVVLDEGPCHVTTVIDTARLRRER
jgi:hypothetical protein